MTDLEWLTNLIESKALFILGDNWEGYLTPRIELETQEQEVADKVKEIILSLNCTCHLKNFIPDKRKPYIRVTILGLKRVQKFLYKTNTCYKDAKTKKKSELLLNYCNYRLSTELKEKRSQEDYKILNQLKQLDK